jgi:shikimate dehydrogenase
VRPGRVGASTRIAGIIGSPVRHSLSPAMHNAAFAACGLDWTFFAFEVARGDARRALEGMRSLGLAGLSVTMPHKADVAWLVDDPSPTVERLGAANTVVATADGRLAGENTDGAGFVDALQLDHDVEVAGASVAIVGAGGAARAVILALADAGCAELIVVNRTVSTAEVAAGLAGSVGRAGRPADVAAADLVVNATPLGMGDADALPLDPAHLESRQVVADLVYQPRRTPLLEAAAARGCQTVDGLGMLVHQGAKQFELWTGVEAPRDVMRAAVEDALIEPV